MKIQKIIFATTLILVTLLTIRCSDDEAIPRAYPRVKTLPVSDISDSSNPILNAEIITLGNEEITNMGFVWSKNSDPTIESVSSLTINLSGQNTIGNFNTSIEQNLVPGVVYNVRAFVRTKINLVYGNNVSFENLNDSKHEITEFIPISGNIGDTISIVGTNFIEDASKITVKFIPSTPNIILGRILTANTNKLTVIVPSVPSGLRNFKLGLEIAGSEVLSTSNFVIN